MESRANCGKETVEGAGNCGRPLPLSERAVAPLNSEQPKLDSIHNGSLDESDNVEKIDNATPCEEGGDQRNTKQGKDVSGAPDEMAKQPHLDAISALQQIFADLENGSKFVVPLSQDVSSAARDVAVQNPSLLPGETPLALFGEVDKKGRMIGILVTDVFVRWRMRAAESLRWSEGRIEYSKIASIGLMTVADGNDLMSYFVVNDNPTGLFANSKTDACLLLATTEFCKLVTERPPELKQSSHSVEWMFNGNIGEKLPTARFSYAVACLCVLMYLIQWMMGAFDSDWDFARTVRCLGGNLPTLGYLFCGFMHGGLIHLAANLIGIVTFGAAVERTFGSKLFAWVYLASVFGGGVSAAMSDPYAITVGASGGLFGIMGAICVFGVIRYLAMRKQLSFIDRKRVFRWVKGYGALLWGNIYCTAKFSKIANISVEAHGGGLLVGFVLGFVALILVPPRREQESMDNAKKGRWEAWADDAREKTIGIWSACKKKIAAIWKSGPKGKAICVGVAAVILLVLMRGGCNEYNDW